MRSRSRSSLLSLVLVPVACGGGASVDTPAVTGASAGSAGSAGAMGVAGNGSPGGAASTGGVGGSGGAGAAGASQAGFPGQSGAAGLGGGGGVGGSPKGGASGAAGAGGAKPLSSLVLVVRTGDGAFDGTDDAATFCATAADCFGLDNAEIDDRQSGSVDHHELDPKGLTRAELDRVSLTTNPGTNAWKPTCVALIADGELVYCNDQLGGVVIGSDTGEKKTFVDTSLDKKTCQSCYGGSPITHGPMVGHTTSTTAKIWARAGSSRAVAVRYGVSADLSGAKVSAPVTPAPSHDFTFETELDGLAAATRYHYALEVDGVVVTAPPYPSFATAPAATAKFSFAFGSCARIEKQAGSAWEGLPVFAAIAAAKPDLLVMAGDNHYANTTDTARLRFFYRQSRDVASFAKLAAATPTWAMWDDHDFGGNDVDGTISGKDRSVTAFADYWANASAGSSGTPGIWHRFTWGGVDFFLLDDRYHRIGASMLGAQQLSWLKAQLSSSAAPFKIVGTGSVWNDDGSGDSWAAFKGERDGLFDYVMQQKIPGVVLISGDIHRSSAFRVRSKSATSYPLYELVASPFGNSPSACGSDPSALFCDSAPGLFGLVKVDTTLADPTLSFEIRDDAGKVLHTLATKRSELALP